MRAETTVSCNNCGKVDTVPFGVADMLGGQYYCSDCEVEAPEGHPQYTEDGPRSIVSNLEDGEIDVPHTPEAEAALVQEVRERISRLKKHTGDPTVVAEFEKVDDALCWVLSSLQNTDEYECNCNEYGEKL